MPASSAAKAGSAQRRWRCADSSGHLLTSAVLRGVSRPGRRCPPPPGVAVPVSCTSTRAAISSLFSRRRVFSGRAVAYVYRLRECSRSRTVSSKPSATFSELTWNWPSAMASLMRSTFWCRTRRCCRRPRRPLPGLATTGARCRYWRAWRLPRPFRAAWRRLPACSLAGKPGVLLRVSLIFTAFPSLVGARNSGICVSNGGAAKL
jgi:hypothetical protein